MIKILLVDDEREEREGISFLLQKFKYPVKIIQAANGKEALKYIHNQDIDILFTDVKMPVMNGLELAKEVYEYNPHIKIIIFSAYGEFEYARQALEANATSYLLKPIEVDEFRKLMGDVIGSIHEDRELLKQQQADEQQNRKNLLYKVFTSARIEDAEADKIREVLFLNEKAVCCLVDIEFIDNFFEEHESAFLHFVNMYLGTQVEYVNIYPNKAYLIIQDATLLREDNLEKQLGKLLRDLKEKNRDEALLLISSPITMTSELSEQLEQMNDIHMDVFGYGDRILKTSDYYHEMGHYASDVEAVRRQLELAIESKDITLIRRHNKDLVKMLSSLDKVSRLYLQNLLYSIIKDIYDKLPRLEYANVLVSAEALFQIRDLKTTISEYEKNMDIVLNSLDQERADESHIVQKIKSIVEKEYMKDISLNYVADQVNLAPAYVSYIFKKETDQNLIKYITDIKMMKAKQLLEEGNLKMIQISHACGYENQSYFNRLFKNYYGMTPKQYREKL